MYKRSFLIIFSLVCAVTFNTAMAEDDQYFVGFSSGRLIYSHNDTNQTDKGTVLVFTLGQYFRNNIFISASYMQFKELFIKNEPAENSTNYDISGVRFSVGKEIPLQGMFTTSADIGVLRWLEKSEIRSLNINNAGETPVTLDEKGYSLGIGLNLNMTLSDKTKVSLRMEGSSTDNFGFRTMMLNMQFDI